MPTQPGKLVTHVTVWGKALHRNDSDARLCLPDRGSILQAPRRRRPVLRFWPSVLLTTAVLAFTACEDAQEVLPSASATTEPSAAASVSPSPALSPSATQTPIPCPTGDCSRLSMYMGGPTEAKPGDTVVYHLTYEVRTQESTVIIAVPRPLKYVSSELLSGSGFATKEPNSETIDLRWALKKGTGVLALAIQIPVDVEIGSSFAIGADEPGSGTDAWRPSSSNAVTTTIV